MTELSTTTANNAELTLVLGVDGSGKSTFLSGLSDTLGFEVLEPTSSPEAKAFKVANINTPVDGRFVDAREAIFLNLNQEFDTRISSLQASKPNIATTGNSLVTRVSHGVMRLLVDAPNKQSIDDIVAEWAESTTLKPSEVVLIHAPQPTIRERILERQAGGDTAERFWGFNAPYFLAHYQDALHASVEALGKFTSIRRQSLDSTVLSPDAMIETYKLEA